jgi:predicted DNA-binding protein
MEVRLVEDLEAQLNELAVKTGRGTNELVQTAIARMLEYDTRFIEAVEEAVRSAARQASDRARCSGTGDNAGSGTNCKRWPDGRSANIHRYGPPARRCGSEGWP